MTSSRLALTTGEPAGIGPDILILLGEKIPKNTLIFADIDTLKARAALLNRPFPFTDSQLRHVPVSQKAQPGQLNPANSTYVLACLQQASEACLQGEAQALVTAPVHKGVICDAGFAFTGHTEWLRDYCHCDQVVMMLCCSQFKVALVTTHLSLAEVPAAITPKLLQRILEILAADLEKYFSVKNPRIAVCGLNPHAGEQGHLGKEEITVISPVIQQWQQQGKNVYGPFPADTLFTPQKLKDFDVALAMYHDQGLPVLKYASFGEGVNVTLGLPFLRTSVDHGTALELAGTGRVDPGSLLAALEMARGQESP